MREPTTQRAARAGVRTARHLVAQHVQRLGFDAERLRIVQRVAIDDGVGLEGEGPRQQALDHLPDVVSRDTEVQDLEARPASACVEKLFELRGIGVLAGAAASIGERVADRRDSIAAGRFFEWHLVVAQTGAADLVLAIARARLELVDQARDRR